MIKNWEYLTFVKLIKFNGVQIKLNSNGIVATKKSQINGIVLITKYNKDSINLKGINKKKLLSKEYDLAQRAKQTYIASIYQPKTFFDLFQAAQTIEFLSHNIAFVNKKLQDQITNKF